MSESLQHLRYALQDPHFLARGAILTACPALACLVAIWAATSQRHWFFRALGIWAAVAIMVPIRAYEPAWLLAASLPLIVAMLGARNRWDRKRSGNTTNNEAQPGTRFRFGTRDLLLLMVTVGMWLVVVIQIVPHYRPDNWYGWLVSAFGLAAISVLAYGCVASQRRQSAIALLLCALPAVALAIWSAGKGLRWHLIGVSGTATTLVADLVFLTLAGAELALIVIAASALGRVAASPARSVRWRLLSGTVLAVGCAAAAVPLSYLYCRLLERPPHAPKSEIAVNHYHRIVQIANEVNSLNPQNVSQAKLRLSAPQSKAPRQIGVLYAELLPLLAQANAVDYDADRDATPESVSQISPVQACRALARCLIEESEEARENHAYDIAADHALAVLSLGTMLRRGGLPLEAIVGVAIERMAQSQLAKLRGELPPTQSRKVIAALARSHGLHEDLAVINARAAHYEDQVFGWMGKLENVLYEFSPYVTFDSLERADMHAAASSLLLQADLAIRLHQHDKGRPPADLAQLVPEYLPAVPMDPYSEQPLVYRQESGGGYVLYSVGFDRQDNGGRFGSPTDYNNAQHRKQSGLDLNLETIIWRR